MVSPDRTGYVRRNRYSTVMPCSIIAAACCESMPGGTFTILPAGIRRSSAYEPTGGAAYATRSPTATEPTPSPTASTTPAPSIPGENGSDGAG